MVSVQTSETFNSGLIKTDSAVLFKGGAAILIALLSSAEFH
jgi:hypothetical protein